MWIITAFFLTLHSPNPQGIACVAKNEIAEIVNPVYVVKRFDRMHSSFVCIRHTILQFEIISDLTGSILENKITNTNIFYFEIIIMHCIYFKGDFI